MLEVCVMHRCTQEGVHTMIFFMHHISKGMELSCSLKMVIHVLQNSAELRLRTEVEGSHIFYAPFCAYIFEPLNAIVHSHKLQMQMLKIVHILDLKYFFPDFKNAYQLLNYIC